MGEHRTSRILRASAVAALAVASAVTLSSCSQLAVAPGGATPSSSGAVVEPTSPAATPSETVASDSPLPTPTETASSAPSSTADARTAVQPAITTADWDASAQALDVSAIVPGVVEGGGTCAVTVTSGSVTRTASSTGVAASSYTGCPSVAITGLTPGPWQVRVRYSSEKSVGSSEKSATVPNG